MSRCCLSLLPAMVLACSGLAVGPAIAQDRLLRDLPPGVVILSTADASADQALAIGQRLGGEIRRLSNNQLSVHGASIKVNIISARDKAAADAIEAALAKLKGPPFLWRDENRLIEFVSAPGSEALGWKTAWELGLAPKPEAVTWRLEAELGLVDEADCMVLNPLFNAFLALQQGNDPAAAGRIEALAQGVVCGTKLRLRNPASSPAGGEPEFEPPPTQRSESGGTVTWSFDRPQTRNGISFVQLRLEGTANSKGFVAAEQPDEALTMPSDWWPADDTETRKLAASITGSAEGHDAKAEAILKWLAPGRNIKYDGETGSRYGVKKVLEQRFGHCWDFADVFVTLARAAGVPARQTAGWLYGTSGHVWAEYYSSEGGWQQVDPTGGGQLDCGIYHIAYFTTEDGDMPILYLSMPRLELTPAEN